MSSIIIDSVSPFLAKSQILFELIRFIIAFLISFLYILDLTVKIE